MGQDTIYEDGMIEVVRGKDNLVLKYKKPHSLTIPADDKGEIDCEVVRMVKMRDEEGKKYLTQEQIGKIIGVSRQMVNRRWQVYKTEGLISLLSGNWEKSKITNAFLDRLAEISVENPFLSASEIKDILQEEGLCDEVSEATVYNAQRQMNGRRIIELMRKKVVKNIAQSFIESEDLLHKLFVVIEGLSSGIPRNEEEEAVVD
ncbi:MAG: helix-turn-helix domain-containing protein [Spirochaetes bacterium]|nr:helix-turn-helix domain-containing protein [Spirochaetota bacterium]